MAIFYIGGLLCAVFTFGALANGFNPPRRWTIVVAPMALLPWIAFLNYDGLIAIPALTCLAFVLSFIGVNQKGDIETRNHRDFLILKAEQSFENGDIDKDEYDRLVAEAKALTKQ